MIQVCGSLEKRLDNVWFLLQRQEHFQGISQYELDELCILRMEQLLFSKNADNDAFRKGTEDRRF